MSVQLKTTDHDHIPEEFTLEGLAQTLTPEEVQALMGGDDPILTTMSDGEADPPQAQPQNPADPAAQTPQQPQAQQPQAPQVPVVDPAKVAEAKAKITTAESEVNRLDDELIALKDRYDIGEISNDQWLKEQKALIAAQTQAQMALRDSQAIIQQAAQAAQATWYSELDGFKAKGMDFLWSEQHLGDWDRALRSITGNASFANLSHQAKIELAYDMYAASYRAMAGKELPPRPTGKADPGTGKGEPRKDPRPDPVQTLTGFNTDTASAITDGTFAVIDRTMEQDPIAAEKMFQRLSPEQQQEFLERV